MFFLLVKEEGIWVSSTASTKRYEMTNAAAGYIESEEKTRV